EYNNQSSPSTFYNIGPETGNSYSYSRTITIAHSKVPNTDQSGFPVLVNITDATLKTVANGGHVQNSNGYDMIFTSDSSGASVLNYERDVYNSSTGQLITWVNIPTLSHTADTTIYLWYGSATVVGDESNRTAVWDSNYQGVWHFSNAGSPADSTSNGNTLTNNG